MRRQGRLDEALCLKGRILVIWKTILKLGYSGHAPKPIESIRLVAEAMFFGLSSRIGQLCGCPLGILLQPLRLGLFAVYGVT